MAHQHIIGYSVPQSRMRYNHVITNKRKKENVKPRLYRWYKQKWNSKHYSWRQKQVY